MFKLTGDDFNAAGLFNGVHSDAPGVASTEWRFRQLHHGMFGVGIETFTELREDFDGVA